MMITSGIRRCAASNVSSPVVAKPTIFMLSSHSRRAANPSRAISWSSTTRICRHGIVGWQLPYSTLQLKGPRSMPSLFWIGFWRRFLIGGKWCTAPQFHSALTHVHSLKKVDSGPLELHV
jgi:hypothetical protein